MGRSRRQSIILKRVSYILSACNPIIPPLIALIIGIVIGLSSSRLQKRPVSLLTPRLSPMTSLRTEVISADFLNNGVSQPSFGFVFSTGRSGTQHLSRVLKTRLIPTTYITHEEEHATSRTRFIVEHKYRRLAGSTSEGTFNESMEQYIRHVKIPFYHSLLSAHQAQRLVYTGHVPAAFGALPAIIETLPIGSIRVLRFRRDRVATALSLMALGREEEDPWGATQSDLESAPTSRRRWFPTPDDKLTRLAAHNWTSFNRFQRWLWYVDDVECRWQALRHGMRGRFSFAEESLDALQVLDGGVGWKRVADFMGVDVDHALVSYKHNSIQSKNRSKEAVPERVLRQWDEKYRQMVGPCRIAEDVFLSWDTNGLHNNRIQTNAKI